MARSIVKKRTVGLLVLARRLVEDQKVFRFEHETLSSGLPTPFMVDFQHLSEETLTLIAQRIRDIATRQRFAFTHVAGVPTGGNAFAIHVAQLFPERKLIRLSRENRRMWVDDERHFSIGDRVLIVEDVLTTGKNALEAVHALANYGLTIVGLIAVCDREQRGRVSSKMHGYPAMALFTARELLAVARHTRVATEEQYQEAIAYLEEWRCSD